MQLFEPAVPNVIVIANAVSAVKSTLAVDGVLFPAEPPSPTAGQLVALPDVIAASSATQHSLIPKSVPLDPFERV